MPSEIAQWKTWEPLGTSDKSLRGERWHHRFRSNRLRDGQTLLRWMGHASPLHFAFAEDRVAQQLQATRVDFEELMRRSDVVEPPLRSHQSRDRIAHQSPKLGWMKPTAILVNTARGEWSINRRCTMRSFGRHLCSRVGCHRSRAHCRGVVPYDCCRIASSCLTLGRLPRTLAIRWRVSRP